MSCRNVSKTFYTKDKKEIKSTFEITEDSTGFSIKIIDFEDCTENVQYLFYNIQDKDGKIVYYNQVNLSSLKNESKNDRIVKIDGRLKYEQSLNVFYNGFYQNYKDNKNFYIGSNSVAPITTFVGKTHNYDVKVTPIVVERQKQKKWGYNTKNFLIPYIGFGFVVPFEKHSYFDVKPAQSVYTDYGLKYKYGVCKWYGIGTNFGLSHTIYRLNSFDSISNVTTNFVQVVIPTEQKNKYNKLYVNALDLEFFQRFRLVPTMFTDVHIDLGIYGAWEFSARYEQKWTTNASDVLQNTIIKQIPLNYGVRMRIGYEIVEFFAQYRISNYFNDIQDLPKLNVGLQIMLGWY